jgi:DNA-binding GntR family transcriptional regulator
MMRPRLAPRAVRSAISRCRATPRDKDQVRDIRAGDQQHQADRADQDDERLPHAAHHLLAERTGSKVRPLLAG